jgi:alkylation response protein AidB-like acyl-CoA dehydrogenase
MTVLSSAVSSRVLGPEIAAVPDDDPFRQEFRAWLAANSPGTPEPLDEREKFQMRRAWQRTLFDGGWAGPAWPERVGGRGAGPRAQYMYYEELALARAPEPVNAPGIILMGPTLMVHGSQELQDRFLPSILSGEDIYAQGFSEPNSGSDLASLRMRARVEGDEWVINGQKIWTSFAHFAGYCFALCRSDPESERHRGLSLIIVPLDQPGITIRPIEQINGDIEFSEVFFDDARAPVNFTVGEPGEGWTVSMTMFQFERADNGFTDHARLLVRLDDIRKELRKAAADGRLAPREVEDLRRRLVELWIRSQQLRRFNLRVALRGDRGEQIGMFGSVVNLFWAELEKEVAEFGAAVHGPRGLVAHTHPAYHLLTARSASIFSGTSEIQRNIIAERVVGLPR